MNFKNFSLDYLEPSVAVANKVDEQSTAWTAAVKYYGAPIVEILRNDGAKTVRELFQLTTAKTGTTDLGLDQFDEIIKKMISETKDLIIVQAAPSLEESVVALQRK